MSDPWLKFYPTDWRSDPALRMCGMAARGLWIEMIALMHEATPYGHLLVSGRSPTDAQLAVLVGAPSDQIPELLGELDAAGVFSRTKEGVIYSRKMTRTAKKTAIARKNGKNGGNPSLCKTKDIQPSDKGQDKGRDKAQKPEARSQIEKRGSIDPQKIGSPSDILSEASSPHAARSFVAFRSKIRKPLTETAARRIAKDLTQITSQGGNADDALGMAEERGWQAIKPDWYFKETRNDQRSGYSSRRSQPGQGQQLSGLAGAAMRRRAAREQGHEG